jgi:hypothetical protein
MQGAQERPRYLQSPFGVPDLGRNFPARGKKLPVTFFLNLCLSLYESDLLSDRPVGTTIAKVSAYQVHNMKTTSSILTLALSISAPAIAALYLAGGAFSTESIIGSYAIAGALYIAAGDYAPRKLLTLPSSSSSGPKNWSQSYRSRSRRLVRSLRIAKASAGC